MKKELRAAWTGALRSGKYRQTQEHLADYEGYCCLGVLCEIVKTQFPELEPAKHVYLKRDAEENLYEILAYGASSNLGAGNSAAAAFGLTQSLADAAARRNDEGESFSQIANWIETNVPEE